MEDYVDNCATELAVVRRKLQSKAEALLILSQELEQCRTEREQFKLIAEQVQNRSLSKKTLDDQMTRGRFTTLHDNFSTLSVNGSNFDHYMEVREQNKALRFEIQDLKQKLREAYGDIKVLRAGAAAGSRSNTVSELIPAHQREQLVEQLEQTSARVSQLEADLRGVLDEKQELVTERESYRCKVHRLNHQINILLKGDSGRFIDIDALIMDNKYLQEQMQQLQAEKELAHQALIKYKSMLEKKRSKGVVRLGTHSTQMVVSHKQVQELLERGTAVQMPDTEATLADLKSLCLALLEALQDKSLALTHQRKANKILASRIAELEHRLGAAVPVFPSRLLLEGYSSAHVDSDLHWLQENQPTPEKSTKENDILHSDSSTNNCAPNTKHHDLVTNGCDTDINESLPEDIQELVTKALQDIREEEAAANRTGTHLV